MPGCDTAYNNRYHFYFTKKIEAPFIKEIMILFGIYSSIMFISILQNCKAMARFLDFVNKYSFQISTI